MRSRNIIFAFSAVFAISAVNEIMLVAESKRNAVNAIRYTQYEIVRTILASHKATQDKPAANGRRMRGVGELHSSDANK
jgi:hypothetical protein